MFKMKRYQSTLPAPTATVYPRQVGAKTRGQDVFYYRMRLQIPLRETRTVSTALLTRCPIQRERDLVANEFNHVYFTAVGLSPRRRLTRHLSSHQPLLLQHDCHNEAATALVRCT